MVLYPITNFSVINIFNITPILEIKKVTSCYDNVATHNYNGGYMYNNNIELLKLVQLSQYDIDYC